MVRKLKSYLAPWFWRIPKKEQHWVYSPSPGPHKKFECIPLAIILRNILKIVDTGKEAETVVKKGEVKIDGRVVKDFRYPVGLFDTIIIEKIEKYYRVVPFKGGLTVKEIGKEESNLKICKVVNRTVVKNGNIQLNLHDGKNIIYNEKVNTQSSLLLELPTLRILDVINLDVGNYVVSIAGNHGIIKNYDKKTKIVYFSRDGESFSTSVKYVYVVGREKPLITI
ncbi:MAG: 30S ribosomal protein S4e [Candidatus Aenigmarchaeota archaeon]|nr:30S ribosomal protein S4e [Candidatus Aenigmarchaeota archaeon]MDW8149476.1 30S ribosomal protein S4e [Candidatus Aenigmarchaeota archaeon]